MASVSSDECAAPPTNSVGHIESHDHSSVHVGNKYTKNIYNEPNHNRCIADLRLTDPRDDKTRIEETQGGLLKDSYKWILDHEDFRRWRDDRDSRLLWIKGDAGKGKTMLLCGIVNELSQSRVALRLLGDVVKRVSCRFRESPLSPTYARHVSFFFCQGTDSRLNHATAVLRGLIYLLLCQVPSLISHIQDRYDHAGRRLFEDTNAFYTLSQVLASILRDRRAKGCYMVIDALDECETGLPQLLNFIIHGTSTSAHVKWIVSSRNRHDIEQQLHPNASRLNLELNAHHVTQAINAYIDHKVRHLVSLEGNKSLQEQVRNEMRHKADGTFLCVALVAKELQKVQSWDILSVLKQIPAGLVPLYRRMMMHIQQLTPKNRELCQLVISTATVAYRPLHLCELGVLSGLPKNISGDPRSVEKVADMSGSFLTIRDGHVYLIHQSVKDFLTTDGSTTIFQRGFAATHHIIFLKSIEIMSETLRRDIYNLHNLGTSIDGICQPVPDPLASARYSCIYWVGHLNDAISHKTSIPIKDLQDDGTVHQFLCKKYLYWLEALGLLRGIPKGVVLMAKLETLLESFNKSQLLDLVRDARRFILSQGWAIGNAPLQAYVSALIFSPRRSITRKLFQGEEPSWIVPGLAIAEDWDACMATLEGHSNGVRSVSFSPDGQHLASASSDKTVKIWDATTGHCQATLTGHSHNIWSVAFSPDGQRLASASEDQTIKIWDTKTGHCKSTLKGHNDWVWSVAFSPDGQRLASASSDETVKIWDVTTGHCQATLKGHNLGVQSVAFSPDGQRLASASGDRTVKIWDVVGPTAGHCQATLEDHSNGVRSVSFSPDGQRLASASEDRTVKIWDVVGPTAGHCQATLEGHDDGVSSVAFSPDGQRLASASWDRTVKIWDAATGHCQATLKGHNLGVQSVAFSDGQCLASASQDRTVKIWDAATGNCQATLESHGLDVHSVTFSPDGQRLASASSDKTVKIWDATTGHCQATLEDHGDWVLSVAFSPDGQRLASASNDRTVKLWDATTGNCQATLEDHSNGVRSVVFSPDGQRLASASWDRTVKIWDVTTGNCQATLVVGEIVDIIQLDVVGARLVTNHGTFDLTQLSLLSSPNTPMPTSANPLHHSPQYQGYGISADRVWVTYAGRNLLWLPSEYRPVTSAIAASTVAVGCSSGRVLLFRFSGQGPG